MGDIVIVITMQLNRNTPEQFSDLKTCRCTHIYEESLGTQIIQNNQESYYHKQPQLTQGWQGMGLNS